MEVMCKQCGETTGQIPSLLSEIPKEWLETHKPVCPAKFYSELQIKQAFKRLYGSVDSHLYDPYKPAKEMWEIVYKELDKFLTELESVKKEGY